MSNALKFAAACGGAVATLYVDDVFIPFTRTGTGASQVTTTNIDMTEGYCLWTKGRSGATDHSVYHSARGVTKDLVTNTTAAETTEAQGLTAVSSTGHTYGTLAKINTNAATYVDWVFRNAANFYHHDVVVKSAGSNATFNFSMHTAGLGMVRVKRTDAAGSWYVWHRSLSAGKLLIGETTAAEATLGHITVSGTTVTLADGVIADGTYLVEAWAHDTSADGMVQCGTWTADGADISVDQVLGWEPQFIEAKQINGTSNWHMVDTSRGWANVSGADPRLFVNTSGAEDLGQNVGHPNAMGFWPQFAEGASSTLIYLAIRRPNKPPTSGTQVYNAIARTGTGADATVTGVGFAPDSVWWGCRNDTRGWDRYTRLRGRGFLYEDVSAENNTSTSTQDFVSWEMDGFKVGTASASDINTNTITGINHCMRRAPGFFDVVCDTGTGSAHTVSHNLTVAPELMIRKGRSGATQWEVWHSAIANTEKLILNSTAAKATDTTAWNSTSPTASVFTVGTGANVNTNTATYVTYLFATLSGISKVGSYTGNGTTQNIEMGFAAGARFFLVKASSTTGSWWVWDSVRGIVAGTDFGLQLNSTAAETTTADAVDPYTGGISVVEEATCALNTNSVTYIYLGIA